MAVVRRRGAYAVLRAPLCIDLLPLERHNGIGAAKAVGVLHPRQLARRAEIDERVLARERLIPARVVCSAEVGRAERRLVGAERRRKVRQLVRIGDNTKVCGIPVDKARDVILQRLRRRKRRGRLLPYLREQPEVHIRDGERDAHRDELLILELLFALPQQDIIVHVKKLIVQPNIGGVLPAEFLVDKVAPEHIGELLGPRRLGEPVRVFASVDADNLDAEVPVVLYTQKAERRAVELGRQRLALGGRPDDNAVLVYL